MVGGSAIHTESRNEEAEGPLDLALRAAADLVGGKMGTCTYSTGWWFAAHDLMMTGCKGFGALSSCVEQVVGSDSQPSPKENKAIEGVV